MTSLRPLAVVALWLTAACAHQPSGGSESPIVRGDARTATTTELANATQLNLYDYLAAERPRWLQPEPTTGTAPTVYVDDAQLGGIGTLRSVTLSQVTLARYYDIAAAQQKFGGRHFGPVIEVLTR
jgi:hypothetical protein